MTGRSTGGGVGGVGGFAKVSSSRASSTIATSAPPAPMARFCRRADCRSQQSFSGSWAAASCAAVACCQNSRFGPHPAFKALTGRFTSRRADQWAGDRGSNPPPNRENAVIQCPLPSSTARSTARPPARPPILHAHRSLRGVCASLGLGAACSPPLPPPLIDAPVASANSFSRSKLFSLQAVCYNAHVRTAAAQCRMRLRGGRTRALRPVGLGVTRSPILPLLHPSHLHCQPLVAFDLHPRLKPAHATVTCTACHPIAPKQAAAAASAGSGRRLPACMHGRAQLLDQHRSHQAARPPAVLCDGPRTVHSIVCGTPWAWDHHTSGLTEYIEAASPRRPRERARANSNELRCDELYIF